MTVFVLAACGDNNNDNEAENNNGEEMDLPEPDLDDVPDVVAEVNGEEVSKDEFAEMYKQQFQQQAMQAQMSGEGGDIDQDEMKEEIAEVMVGQELLTQAADKEVGEVSVDDLYDTMDEYLVQIHMEDKYELWVAHKA